MLAIDGECCGELLDRFHEQLLLDFRPLADHFQNHKQQFIGGQEVMRGQTHDGRVVLLLPEALVSSPHLRRMSRKGIRARSHSSCTCGVALLRTEKEDLTMKSIVPLLLALTLFYSVPAIAGERLAVRSVS